MAIPLEGASSIAGPMEMRTSSVCRVSMWNVRRVEKLNLIDAIRQAVRDAKKGKLPAVFHRRDRCEWLVTMRIEDWFTLYREWEAGQETEG